MSTFALANLDYLFVYLNRDNANQLTFLVDTQNGNVPELATS